MQFNHDDIVYPARVSNCTKAPFCDYCWPPSFLCAFKVTEPNMVVVCLPPRVAFCPLFIQDESCNEHFGLRVLKQERFALFSFDERKI